MGEARTFSGECLCAAVRFEVAPPTRWCLHCHCSLCRKAHGAPFVTWFGIGRPQLTISRGESEIRWRTSSDHGRRAFCGLCGSQLFFVSRKWPGQIDVARALVEGAIDRAPAAHVYVDYKADWVDIGDGLDCYPDEYQAAPSERS